MYRKRSVPLGGRTAVCMEATKYPDLAVIEFSTAGHALFNYAHSKTAFGFGNIFTSALKETEIALGDMRPLEKAAREAKNAGFSHVYLLTSAINSAIGVDNNLLASMAEEEAGLNAFTSEIRYDADAYESVGKFYAACAGFAQCSEERSGYNLLSSGCDRMSAADKNEAIGLLGAFGQPVFANETFEGWKNAGNAALNVVLTGDMLPAARVLERKFGAPYIFFRPFGDDTEALQKIAEALGADVKPKTDEKFSRVMTEFANICEAVGPKFALYLKGDLLSTAEFLGKYAETRAFCTHRGTEYPYIEPDDFIDSVKPDEIVISDDSVCRFAEKSVVFDESGLVYHLPNPYVMPRIGKPGALVLAEKISDILLDL